MKKDSAVIGFIHERFCYDALEMRPKHRLRLYISANAHRSHAHFALILWPKCSLRAVSQTCSIATYQPAPIQPASHFMWGKGYLECSARPTTPLPKTVETVEKTRETEVVPDPYLVFGDYLNQMNVLCLHHMS